MLHRCSLSACCLGIGLALLLLSLPAPLQAQERRLPDSHTEIQLSLAPLVREAAPAVVNIYAKRRVVTRTQISPFAYDPFFQQFLGPGFMAGPLRERLENSLGSGVIVDASGILVTNQHVIEGAEEIRIIMNDRREYDAELLLSDNLSDLAVLQIKTQRGDFPALELGDSDQVEAGDLVLAIGNPFGVGQSVSSGIISASGRTAEGANGLNYFIQTDAAINPGNSGGALIGLNGRVIGINTAIFTRTGTSAGVGFAVPSNLVARVLEASRQEDQRLQRPWFGAEVEILTPDVAASLEIDPPRGVLVNRITPGAAAEQAGLQLGDIITAFDGKAINGPAEIQYRLAIAQIGGQARLDILRRGQARHLTLKLEAPPEIPPRNETKIGGYGPLSGVIAANLSPALAEELNLSSPVEGVILLEVPRQAGLAHRLGLRARDIILSLNETQIENVSDLQRLAENSSRRWHLRILRQGQIITTVYQG